MLLLGLFPEDHPLGVSLCESRGPIKKNPEIQLIVKYLLDLKIINRALAN